MWEPMVARPDAAISRISGQVAISIPLKLRASTLGPFPESTPHPSERTPGTLNLKKIVSGCNLETDIRIKMSAGCLKQKGRVVNVFP